MKLLSLRPLKRRNVYATFPLIRMVIDNGEFQNIPTCEIKGFNDRLLKSLPGLHEHNCSKGYKGGFTERLAKGTYLPHVIEHMALELQTMMGYDVKFGKTRWDSGDTKYFLVYEFENEYAGIEAGKLAFEMAENFIHGKSISIKKRLKEIRAAADQHGFGPSTASIEKAARSLGVPVYPLYHGSLLQLGTGNRMKLVQATVTPGTNCIASDISCDKEMTKQRLRLHNLPVPSGSTCYSASEAVRIAESIGYPVVLKPVDGNQGKGVCVGLQSADEVINSFEISSRFSRRVIVEKCITGRNFRLVVVGGKLVAAAERKPAHVIGNGYSTIKDLIQVENMNPLRGDGHEKPLSKIKIEHVARQVLKKQGLKLSDVPAEGQMVLLRENDNLSTGGTAEDVTDLVHPEVKDICEKAALVVDIEVAGVDVATTDISKPLSETGGAIIEVNTAPGIRMHHFPSKGKKRNVAAAIVKHLFPKPAASRIPLVSVTGTNGKTTTTRMIASIFKEAGHLVGMTSTDGVYIDGVRTEKGDNTGPLSAETVLKNKFVTAAVLETARGGLIRRGLGYDMATVGVVTNISADHLGLDGVEDLDDIAKVKSLIAEAVLPEGRVVLNAADKYCSYMLTRANAEVILFASDPEHPMMQRHISKGGTGVFLKNDMLCIGRQKEIQPILHLNYIPATLNGLLKHNVENALAATAAAFGAGVEVTVIREALSRFTNNEADSPGRFNHFNVKGVNVVLDYGHNKEGYRMVIDSLRKVATGQLIGVLGAPGDRDDETIRETGATAGGAFNRIILKEDNDLRGRKPGEVPKLLLEGINRRQVHHYTDYVTDEANALEKALSLAQPGDWVVIFYEKYEKVRDVVKRYGGTPGHLPEKPVFIGHDHERPVNQVV